LTNLPDVKGDNDGCKILVDMIGSNLYKLAMHDHLDFIWRHLTAL